MNITNFLSHSKSPPRVAPKTTKASQKFPKLLDTVSPKKSGRLPGMEYMTPQSKGEKSIITSSIESTKGLRSPMHPERILFKTLTKKPHDDIIAYDSDGAHEIEERKDSNVGAGSGTALQPTKV